MLLKESYQEIQAFMNVENASVTLIIHQQPIPQSVPHAHKTSVKDVNGTSIKNDTNVSNVMMELFLTLQFLIVEEAAELSTSIQHRERLGMSTLIQTLVFCPVLSTS